MRLKKSVICDLVTLLLFLASSCRVGHQRRISLDVQLTEEDVGEKNGRAESNRTQLPLYGPWLSLFAARL
jgi:hypothetical protein